MINSHWSVLEGEQLFLRNFEFKERNFHEVLNFDEANCYLKIKVRVKSFCYDLCFRLELHQHTFHKHSHTKLKKTKGTNFGKSLI
jgi:hypothetical protein